MYWCGYVEQGSWRRRALAGARHGAEVRLPHGTRQGGRPGDVVGRAQQNLGLGPGLKAGPDILRKVDSSYMFVLRTQLEHTLNLREKGVMQQSGLWLCIIVLYGREAIDAYRLLPNSKNMFLSLARG